MLYSEPPMIPVSPTTPEREGMTLVGDFASRWRLQANDLGHLRTALGEELFTAFCRCFVHGDRLTSLAQLVLLNWRHITQASVAQGRNALTALWFITGTLHELIKGLEGLRSALEKRGWLEPESSPMLRIRDFEDRWKSNALYKSMRDKTAFHVDADVLRAGLDRLAERGAPTLVAEGDGGTDHESAFSIATEALLAGLHADEEAVRGALRAVHSDHKVYLAVQELFVAAVAKADVWLDESDWPGPEVT